MQTHTEVGSLPVGLDGAVLLECLLAWPADTVMISPSAGMGKLSPSQSLSAACSVLRSVMTCPPCAMYWLIWAALQVQMHLFCTRALEGSHLPGKLSTRPCKGRVPLHMHSHRQLSLVVPRND